MLQKDLTMSNGEKRWVKKADIIEGLPDAKMRRHGPCSLQICEFSPKAVRRVRLVRQYYGLA
jgi:hypothetical protein